MKQETQDILIESAKATPGVLATTFTLNTAVALATLVFIVLQIAYLVRKWIREETEWGVKLKNWAKEKFTQPGDLS